MLLLENPGNQEVGYLVRELFDGPDEIQRRRERFPEITDSRFVTLGAPIVGPSGNEICNWALKQLNIQRSDLFIDNCLRCLPPKGKTDSHYPTGAERKLSEGVCTKLWSRIDEFSPDAAVINFHPAAILRDVTPLPVQIRAFEKAKWLMSKGHRVIVCCGGKAADLFFGYGSNVTRFAGHWQVESDFTWARRRERWARNLEVKMVKVKKVKKLTARTALVRLLSLFQQGEATNIYYPLQAAMLTDVEYNEMLALCTPKPKKNSSSPSAEPASAAIAS